MGEASLDDWDSIAFDPHRQDLDRGVKDGEEAGRLAGFNDGRALGRQKGVEYGMELGFIRGVVGQLMESESEKIEEKIRKNLRELTVLLNEFPTPEEIFEQEKFTSNDQVNESLDNEENQTNSTSILQHMQRIRARFKLLMVQLKEPHFSLKQVMADAAELDQTPLDNEW